MKKNLALFLACAMSVALVGCETAIRQQTQKLLQKPPQQLPTRETLWYMLWRLALPVKQ